MIVRPDRHKEGGILAETPIAIISGGAKAQRPPRSVNVAPPSQLDVDGGPSPPVGGVVPGGACQPLVGEFVAKVIGYVSQMFGFQGECFGGLDAREGG